MGCTLSRLECNNGCFLQTRRADSKKELLSHDVKISISSNDNNPSCSLEDIIKKPNRTEIKIETAAIIIAANNNYDIMKDVAKKEDEDNNYGDDNDDERMIGYPGSPSFRIYFKENSEDIHNQIGENDEAIKESVSASDIIPPKELPSYMEKKGKREKTKRCFRKVLPKRGQASAKSILGTNRGAQTRSSTPYRVPSVMPN